MSNPASCCAPCDSLEQVLVPGLEGDPGTDGNDGTNGVNAYTLTTVDFVIPAVSSTVTVTVADTSWMVLGQKIFVGGAGYFEVATLISTTQVELENLGYTDNSAPGTNISSGAGVSPGGTQPSLAGLAASGANTDITSLGGLTTPLSEAQGGTGRIAPVTPLTVYGSGAAFTLTAANNPVVIGATTIELALTTPGTWLLLTDFRPQDNGVSSTVGATFTATLNRTNNTPGAIANASSAFVRTAPGVGPFTRTVEQSQIPPIIYKTANSNDNIQLKAVTSAIPDSAGTYEIGAASLVAVWLNSETV